MTRINLFFIICRSRRRRRRLCLSSQQRTHVVTTEEDQLGLVTNLVTLNCRLELRGNTRVTFPTALVALCSQYCWHTHLFSCSFVSMAIDGVCRLKHKQSGLFNFNSWQSDLLLYHSLKKHQWYNVLVTAIHDKTPMRRVPYHECNLLRLLVALTSP